MDAMNDGGVTVNGNHVVSGGFFDFKYSKLAMEAIIKSAYLPTAVFIAGDIMALGAIQACQENSIVIPNDMSIVGFDNLNMLEWIAPALTTVGQDYKRIAMECCTVLDEAIDDKTIPYIHKVIPTHIIERNSCKAI